MDAYLAVVSKREVREYADRSVPAADLDKILQAGRATGSARNRQPWRFVLVTDRQRLRALARFVAAPPNLEGCAAAIAISMPSAGQGFDAGRAAQNMMLAAWSLGIGSCPNSVVDQDQAREVLEVASDRHIQIILSLGYPRRAPRLEATAAEAVLERIDRRPLDELVQRLD